MTDEQLQKVDDFINRLYALYDKFPKSTLETDLKELCRATARFTASITAKAEQTPDAQDLIGGI